MVKKISRKEQKALEEFAAIAGIDPEKLRAMQKETYPHASSKAQAEIALNFIQQPQGYLIKTCEECGQSFGTNYRFVANCSDTCRAKQWERRTKVPWNLSGRSQREMWGGEVPLIISPETLDNIEFILKKIQEGREAGRILVQEEDQESTTVPSADLEQDDQEATLEIPEFLPSPEFDPTLEFLAQEEYTSDKAHTNPQPEPSPKEPSEYSDLPSFSLFD